MHPSPRPPKPRMPIYRPRRRPGPYLDCAAAFHLSTDAGPLFWGGCLRTRDGRVFYATGAYPLESSSSDIDDGIYHRNQPWREGYASLQCLHAFAHLIPPGSAVLHEGDCACVVAAINRGTSGSIILHRLALKIWRAAAHYSILLFSGWVPGDEIIRSGADSMSRDRGLDWNGLGLDKSTKAWAAVQALLSAQGWQLTLDLFASAENNKCERFFSRFHVPAAEHTDAFSAATWTDGTCPCGGQAREVVLAFPPHDLTLKMWSRLEREQSRGIAVVRRHTTATWWPIMLNGLLGRYIRVKGAQFSVPAGCEPALMRAHYYENDYVILAFDFRKTCVHSAPHLPPPQVAPCLCAATFRGKPRASATCPAVSELELRLLLAASTLQARALELRGRHGN